MPSQGPHPVMSLVVQTVQSLANRQNQQKHAPSGNSQLPPAKIRDSVPAGKGDSSQGESSTASTIQGQNSTTSSSLNNSRVADTTPSATQRRSIITPTATPGKSSRNTPARRGTSQTHSTCRIVSSPASCIASTHTPLSSFENLSTPIPNPEPRVIITNPLRTRATERNQSQRKWQLQKKEVSTPRSVVSGSRSIHLVGQLTMTRLVFATGRLRELYIWQRPLFMSASDLETVSYATRRFVKASVEALHW